MFPKAMILSAVLMLPFGAQAHEFHDLSRLDAVVTATPVDSEDAHLAMTLTNNRDTSVQLFAVYSDLGMIQANFPLEVAPGDTIHADLLVATGTLPGIFTLILDFGENGQGPVLVIPEEPAPNHRLTNSE